MKNFAIVFPEKNKVDIEEIPIPDLAEDQVLIKTSRSLISIGTELAVLTNSFPDEYKKEYPHYPGYNNVGEIIEVGKSVNQKYIGKRVGTYGKHQNYTVASIDACRFIPDDISDELAAFFTHAEIAMNGVRKGLVTWGETVVVYGLGLVGQLAARFCYFAGARPVIGIDISPERMAYLPYFYNLKTINPLEVNALEEVKRITHNRMVDVVFETTGNPAVIPRETKIIRKLGRLVILGSPRGITPFNFNRQCSLNSIKIIGAHNNSHPDQSTPENPWTQKRHTELFFEIIKENQAYIQGLISHQSSFKEATKLYNLLLNDRTKAMGIILDWNY